MLRDARFVRHENRDVRDSVFDGRNGELLTVNDLLEIESYF